MAYIIKYYRKGTLAFLLPFLFPDGQKVINTQTSSEAIEEFHKNHDMKDFEIYSIKRVL